MRSSRRSPLSLAFVVLAFAASAAQAQTYDLILRGGAVLDGTGTPAVRADVGIRADEIVAVGRLDSTSASRIVDVTGLTVSPGFIDMHSHADRTLVDDDEPEGPIAHNLVAQGITTVVVGPDGRNPIWPVADEMAAYRRRGTGLNVVPMVGHATVRGLVMGDDYERPATADEIDQMGALVRQGMESGAWGLGAGPEYRPGRFSTTEELIALAQVVADYDGFYYAHQRSQSPLPRWQTPSILDGWRLTATDGMKETIRIGREAGIRVVGSHIKAKGPSTWGHSAVDILLIEQARAEGVQVYLDQYPYETFGGGPSGVVPPWAFAPPGMDRSGGLDDPVWRTEGLTDDYKSNLRSHLADAETRRVLHEDIAHILDLQGGPDRHVIVVSPDAPDLIGQTLAGVSKARGVTPTQQLLDFALEGTTMPSGVLFRPIAGHSFDVVNYMKQEYTATGTDAGVSLRPRPGLHPRYYGSYARKLGQYVREGAISLPFAVRSSTGLPSQIVGLIDRGFIRPGYKADLVVFDAGRIADQATILDPQQYPVGITYVIVNGEFTVDDGKVTGALPGVVLDRRVERDGRPKTQ